MNALNCSTSSTLSMQTILGNYPPGAVADPTAHYDPGWETTTPIKAAAGHTSAQ